MSIKGKKLSEEHKRKLSNAHKKTHKIKNYGFQKGHPQFSNKGCFKKGHKPIFTPFIKGHTPWHKGKKAPQISKARMGHSVSQKTREKISKALKGRKLPEGHPFTIKGRTSHLKGKKLPNRSGKNCNLWKDGITPENMKIRSSMEFLSWREKIFKRDNYTCWICLDDKGGNLNAHHLKSFSQYPKLRLIVSNGLTLCEFCHKVYTPYGNKIKRYG